MKKTIIYRILLLFLLFFSSCEEQKYAKVGYQTNPKFTWSFAQFYGDYYSNYNISNNVLTLHFFTDGLKLVDGQLVGQGQYLILEDVFLAPNDTLLPKGTYLPKETGEPFSYFCGKYFYDNTDKNPAGAYLYYIDGNAKSSIKLIKEGKINVNTMNDSIYQIDMSLKTADNITITGTYKNTIPHLDMIRKRHQRKVYFSK